MDQHIVREFDSELMQLRMAVLALGGLVADQVQAAVVVLTEESTDGLDRVISRRAQVQAAAARIDDEVIGLLARRQPVASDLRTLLALRHVVTDLVRVDHAARKIARLGVEIRQSGCTRLSELAADARRMSTLALAMLREALDALDRGDEAGAERIQARDELLDGEFQQSLSRLVEHEEQGEQHLRSTLQTVFMLKALERVGDHAGSIAGLVPQLARSSASPVSGTP